MIYLSEKMDLEGGREGGGYLGVIYLSVKMGLGREGGGYLGVIYLSVKMDPGREGRRMGGAREGGRRIFRGDLPPSEDGSGEGGRIFRGDLPPSVDGSGEGGGREGGRRIFRGDLPLNEDWSGKGGREGGYLGVIYLPV